jgi:cardiolipin synthase A/B
MRSPFRNRTHASRARDLLAWTLRVLGAGLLLLGSCVQGPRGDMARSASFADSSEFARPMGGGTRVATGPPELFVTAESIREKMLALIEGARKSILIDSYLAAKSGSTSRIVAALERKQASGVRVHVMADASSRFVPAGSIFDELTRAGIPWAEFNSINLLSWLMLPHLIERDHRKVWIIDGNTIFLGGANITGDSLGQPGYDGNMDFMVAFDSPDAARGLIASFVATWNHSSPRKLRAGDFEVPEEGSMRSAAWIFDQQLDGREPCIGPMFGALFASARREIWLLHPYAFTNPSLLRMIRGASARGVKVNLLLARRTNHQRFIYASYYGIRDIQKAGGRVWIYDDPGTPLHFKGAIVDGKWTCVGSANLNHRSFALSRETAVVFRDAGLARAFAATVEAMRRRSREVSPEEARRYRTLRYWIWWKALQYAG